LSDEQPGFVKEKYCRQWALKLTAAKAT